VGQEHVVHRRYGIWDIGIITYTFRIQRGRNVLMTEALGQLGLVAGDSKREW